MYYIEGKHSIIAAVKNPNRRKKIFIGQRKIYQNLHLNCEFMSGNQNYLAVNELFINTPLIDYFDHNKIILLDSIFDPRNTGAIIRTAAALGFYVLIREQRGCPMNSTVVKCATGGVDYTKISVIKNYVENMKILKNKNFFVTCLSENGNYNITEIKNKKIILIIGSEGNGISELSKKIADFNCYIPTDKYFSTLNASVAAAISMFNLR